MARSLVTYSAILVTSSEQNTQKLSLEEQQPNLKRFKLWGHNLCKHLM